MIPIIIPAYEPDKRLIDLLLSLKEEHIENIIIVNDGSGKEYEDIFSIARELLNDLGGVILEHKENRGKGRALKTAFRYVLDNIPEAVGVVTADSDGQHTARCIKEIKQELQKNQDALILGVRKFDGDNIPWKSKIGNNLTLKVFKLVSGLDIRDTQTGLRGINRKFMKELLSVEGDRFEFETKMLLETVGKYPIVQVDIETVYDSRENHKTHFDPVKDSIKIYRILFDKFGKFMLSSLSSFILDIILFTLFCNILKGDFSKGYIIISTIVARTTSALYNYTINYRIVFKSEESKVKAGIKYFILAIIQMICSALLVTLGCKMFGETNETIIKIIVDTILFFISYQMQKIIVFKKL